MKQKELYSMRLNLGISQREMAKQLGISESFYMKIENNERNISKNFLEKLKNKFPDMDMNIFFN